MKKKHNQGFSLVELLLAIAILALIMVAIASFMSTTTSTYVRSRDDAELQEDGQEVYDMIADRIAQANMIRIGTENAEYANPTAYNAKDVDPATGNLLRDDGSAILAMGSSRNMKSFYALTPSAISASDDLLYIAVLYDAPIDDVDSVGSYGPAADMFYFKEGKIYLFRSYYGDARGSAREVGPSGATDPTDSQLDTWLTLCIYSNLGVYSSASDDVLKDHLVCDTLEYADFGSGVQQNLYIYARPEKNALCLKLGLKKGNITNTVEGVITIRNSYVLEPRKYTSPYITSDPDDAAAMMVN